MGSSLGSVNLCLDERTRPVADNHPVLLAEQHPDCRVTDMAQRVHNNNSLLQRIGPTKYLESSQINTH